MLDVFGRQPGAPGGGSAAAMVVALGAALVEMAARASGEHWDQAGGTVAQAVALRDRALALVSRDAEAYDAAVVALSGGGDEPLGDALARAAAVPLQIAHLGVDVAQVAQLTAEHGGADL